ncbi:Kila-N-RING finger protein [Murmansk poxvirus]|uniref:Kila-N-RING finger protein n=1 Tax=Murmansk poxvirus TaxID=2025359 RepID=A0A223FN05_9POXV|nr:Kila-N-RING finger protein [Murmansk poxvirus]AST09371.1 Kila-N-RING finger protein [Murmansk poxvirus]
MASFTIDHYNGFYRLSRYGISFWLTNSVYINIYSFCDNDQYKAWRSLEKTNTLIQEISNDVKTPPESLIYKVNSKKNPNINGIYMHYHLVTDLIRIVKPEIHKYVSSMRLEFELLFIYFDNFILNTKWSRIHNNALESILTILNEGDNEVIENKYKKLLRSFPNNVKENMEIYNNCKDEECNICMERVYSKPYINREFCILSSCNHVFCIECATKWHKECKYNHLEHRCAVCRRHYSDLTYSWKLKK